MTHNSLFQRDIISATQLSEADIKLVLSVAKKLKQHAAPQALAQRIIAQCFFEPSTRTRLSFEAATLRLGGQNIGFADNATLSVKKGETLHDTIRVINDYADLIVIRHPAEGAAALAAEVASCPVINAGDGANQHPTQALVDLFTIQECQGKLDGLSMAIVGDLKFGRTIHSLAELCAYYDIRLYLVAPESLLLPDAICDKLKKRGVRFSFHDTIAEVIPKVDILYMQRIQQERFSNAEYQFVKNRHLLTLDLLQKTKPNLKIMHPLPRVNEIDSRIDKTPFAYYFQQAANGVAVRQALLTLLLNEKLP